MTSPPLTEKWVPLWPTHSQYQLGDELAYAEGQTSNLSITATSEATAQTIVTAPAVTCDGSTPIIVDYYSQIGSPPNSYLNLVLFMDGVSLGTLGGSGISGTGTMYDHARPRRRLTPAAGSHVFSIRAWVGAGTGTVYGGTGGPGQALPASIRISRVSPVPPAVSAGPLTPVTYGTSLPVSPADGQEAILVDSVTNPTYQWRFRYNAGSSSAYKWEFVGGSKLAGGPSGIVSIPSGTTWTDITGSPVLTVPRAGEYLIDYSLWAINAGTFAGAHAIMGRSMASVAGAGYELEMSQPTSAFAAGRGTGGEKRTLAASETVRIQSRMNAAGNTAQPKDVVLRITPVRVA